MSVLTMYLLFALTTALTAMYELFLPILKEYAVLEPTDVLSENPIMARFICFVGSLVFAPVIFPIAIIPSMSTWFKKSLLDAWTQQAAKI